MQLYLFEHCFLCFRVRMTAALNGVRLHETVVLDDDSDTMVRLIGKRAVPILVKADGTAMTESMEIARHVDGLGERCLAGPERPEIARWADETVPKAAPLTQARYPLLGLPELATRTALDHYHARKRKTLGDLADLRNNTDTYLAAIAPQLAALEALIESPHAVNGALSWDDIRVLPQLRSLAVVKAIGFPPRTRAYFNTMMGRIGHRPLPSV